MRLYPVNMTVNMSVNMNFMLTPSVDIFLSDRQHEISILTLFHFMLTAY